MESPAGPIVGPAVAVLGRDGPGLSLAPAAAVFSEPGSGGDDLKRVFGIIGIVLLLEPLPSLSAIAFDAALEEPVAIMSELSGSARRIRQPDGGRIRAGSQNGDSISSLFPSEGAATPVQAATLGFDSVQGYQRYRVDAGKPPMQGEAAFSTLSTDDARRRSALKAHVDATGDMSMLAVLAEVDRALGLRREACAELQAALSRSVANRASDEALNRFD
jgi:hypothetical protein